MIFTFQNNWKRPVQLTLQMNQTTTWLSSPQITTKENPLLLFYMRVSYVMNDINPSLKTIMLHIFKAEQLFALA